MALPSPTQMTEAEYLAFERDNALRHEYVAGEVFAMAGAKRAHNVICTNIVGVLQPALRGTDCEIYQSDMRVHIVSSRSYRYPDLVIVCGERHYHDDTNDTLLNPVILMEVSSESTAKTDRDEKLREYLDIASLQAYVMIAHDKVRVERFMRRETDLWDYRDIGDKTGQLALPAIEQTIAVADIYDRLTFDSENA